MLFFFQAEDGIRGYKVTGVQTCALPISIAQIEAAPGGAAALVATLHEVLQSKQYRPQAVRRVLIPKPDGKQRPLGIPTVRDRVVQTAATLILGPIFEADFQACSHGYRPGRSAQDAVREVARSEARRV